MNAQQIVGLYGKAKTIRSVFEQHWQEIADFLMPSHMFTRDSIQGSKLRQYIIDSTAPLAVDQLTDALHGLMNNPSIMWFNLASTNRASAKDREEQKWLQYARDETMATYNDSRSGFNTALHEVYGELVVFCTACLHRTYDVVEGIQFSSVPLKEIFLVGEPSGPKRKVIRRFELTADEAVERFASSEAKKLVAAGEPMTKLVYLNYVGPRDVGDAKNPTSSGMPFESIYVEEKTKTQVGEPKGYKRFPFYIPRWKRSPGEWYGRGPGTAMLPEIKQLNKMIETLIAAGEITTFPPMAFPDDGFMLPLKMKPRSINWYRRDLGKAQAYPLNSNSQPQLSFELVNKAVNTINKGFYNDILNLPLVDRMTTVEVFTRRQERQQIMSPVVARIAQELLSPVVKDTVATLVEEKVIEPPPDSLTSIEVTYESPLAASQRSGIAQVIEQVLERTAGMAQLQPDVLDNVDMDYANRELARLYGAPIELMRQQKDVEQRRSARNQAAVAAAVMEGAMSNGGR